MVSKINLHKIYKPITATPFHKDNTYIEIAPCEALAPYIRCFWGTEKPVEVTGIESEDFGIVIPDTCMDIMFNINYTKNKLSDTFSGINDYTFMSGSDQSPSLVSSFAIRFYAWSVVLFSDDSMKNVKNNFFDVDCLFTKFKAQIEPILESAENIYQRIEIVQKILLKRLNINRQNDNVMNTVSQILLQKGDVKMSQLAADNQLSIRQLERLFAENIGVSPKLFSSLIRYQYLWQDIVFSSSFEVQNAVIKYGYTDQSHLLNDFKKRHLMTPTEAKLYASKII